ncbi:hypothetical protein MRB53_006380 [Persea americana]|uniref:Uncharacterized protein n=1 Tax=Persea americana TaxID=3435 RepID=A0ACC2MFZ5_PERAE|nr:hypothetical protein MRB53_006380 [Persea americana]
MAAAAVSRSSTKQQEAAPGQHFVPSSALLLFFLPHGAPVGRHSLLHHSAGHVFLAANTAPFPAEPQPFPSANTLDFSCSRPVNLPIPAASPLGLSSLPPLAANTLLTHRPAAACSGCQLLRAAARNESHSNRRT